MYDKRKRKKALIITIAVVIFAIAAVAAVLFLNLGSGPENSMVEWSNGLVSFTYPEDICSVNTVVAGDGSDNFRLEVVGLETDNAVPRIDLQSVDASSLTGTPDEESFSMLATAILQRYFDGGIDEDIFSVDNISVNEAYSHAVVQIQVTDNSPAMHAEVSIIGDGSTRLVAVMLVPEDEEYAELWSQTMQSISYGQDSVSAEASA